MSRSSGRLRFRRFWHMAHQKMREGKVADVAEILRETKARIEQGPEYGEKEAHEELQHRLEDFLRKANLPDRLQQILSVIEQNKQTILAWHAKAPDSALPPPDRIVWAVKDIREAMNLVGGNKDLRALLVESLGSKDAARQYLGERRALLRQLGY